MPLRARDIADICDDLAIERASVTVMGGWDPDATQFVLTFGPAAYRQIMEIDPKWDVDEVKSKLEAAKATLPAAVADARARGEMTIDLATHKYKPTRDEVKALEAGLAETAAFLKKPAQKRKKANARP